MTNPYPDPVPPGPTPGPAPGPDPAQPPPPNRGLPLSRRRGPSPCRSRLGRSRLGHSPWAGAQPAAAGAA